MGVKIVAFVLAYYRETINFLTKNLMNPMLKHLRNWIHESYLVAAVIYYWILTGNALNLIAIGALVVLAVLIWLKNRAIGIGISAFCLLLNII